MGTEFLFQAQQKYELTKILKNRAVFLDRDGTIIEEREFIKSPKGVSFIPGVFKALKTLRESGFKLVVVSNQSGVARGILTKEMVKNVNRFVQEKFAKNKIILDEFYYCPHHPRIGNSSYTKICNCRKPKSGMVARAKKKFNLDLKKSFVIGDRISDVLLGKNIKAKSILVLTGYGKNELVNLKKSKLNKPDFIARDIREATKWVVKKSSFLSR